jgi:hypothetical protein
MKQLIEENKNLCLFLLIFLAKLQRVKFVFVDFSCQVAKLQCPSG